MKAWKKLKSKVVHKNPWYQVTEDDVALPNGHKVKYFVMKKSNASIIVPCEKDQVYLVKQYRYPISQFTWEFPMGGDDKGESGLKLAKKELHEETGFKAKNWKYIGEFAWMSGAADTIGKIYLAEGLLKGKKKLEEAEQGMIMKPFSIKEVEQMILKNEIIDGGTIVAFQKLKLSRK